MERSSEASRRQTNELPRESRRLTIAVVDAEMGYSGGEVQVFLLLDGLRALGHRPILFCRPGSLSEAECRKRGIERRAVRMRNSLHLTAAFRLARGFKECRADIVHCNTGRDTFLGGIAAWLAGLPAITTRRMEGELARGLRTKIVYHRFFQRAVAISPAVADCLRRAGIPERRIVLIPSTLDRKRIETPSERGAVREALGVSPGEILVLGVGSLIPRKGFDVLFEALAKLPPEKLSLVQARIAGDGPERSALEAKIRALGLEGRVRLLGRTANVGDLFLACDIFVLPSRSEGLGVASLEAMAASRPVVASRVGGLAFAVKDGETGILVPPGDSAALAGALDRLISDPELRRRLGEAGAERAASEFDAQKMVSAYAALYEDVLREWNAN